MAIYHNELTGIIAAKVRFGHQADLFTNVSLMSAVGGIADTILFIFQQFELPVSAPSGPTLLDKISQFLGHYLPLGQHGRECGKLRYRHYREKPT